MGLFKFSVKTSLFLLLTMLLSPFFFLLLFIFYPWRTRIGPKLVQFYSRFCLAIFRVRIEKTGHNDPHRNQRRGAIIISNHSSFLDIFALSSVFASVFVSKAEVIYYPVIGQIAWLMGCVFLKRDSPKERLRLIKRISTTYADRMLAVFPQGTIGRITDRLPFNRGVFKVVELNPEAVILPVTLHYREDEDIAWVKPQSIIENVMRISACDRIHLKVIGHKPVGIDDYQGKTSAEVCRMVEQIVVEPLRSGRAQ